MTSHTSGEPTATPDPARHAGSPAEPQSQAVATDAEQEEHLKRQRSCNAHPGLGHSWDTFSTRPGGPTYQACFRCRVTATQADYHTKTARNQ